jgi:DNA-binding beta-propeller fold protein YncE
MHKTSVSGFTWVRFTFTAGLWLCAAPVHAADNDHPFLSRTVNSSTVPPSGDVNPYGVAFVPEGFPGGGTIATIGQGALQVIDRHGQLVQSWTDAQFLDGPWDLAVDDHGDHALIFVSNVLNGTVSRLAVSVGAKGLTLQGKTILASGYPHVPNMAALILGPTGLTFDENTDTLFVASTADNTIYAIPHAGSRTSPVTRGAVAFADSHLRGPLALRFAPNGDLLAANGDAVNADVLHPSEIVEFTTWGQFVREYNVDSSQGGAFGLDTLPEGPFNYAVIDDVSNNLTVTSLQDR